ncbi:MAG TPA: hypothetical protein VIN07_11195 [Flavipsychrobacter sp.]
MSERTNPLYSINDFFEDYAAALERHDSKYMANCYTLPCIFMSDDSSQVYTTEAKLEGLINQGKRFYTLHGITGAVPDILNKRVITGRIVRVSMRWNYIDKKSRTVYDCEYYYVLKLDEENNWKIEVAIPVNEKEKIDELTKKAARKQP